ncbi:BrnA antitoxin family protein [uncultured Tateyamaria sp.]|uniref:BrnA antitoxin family protein n=1 Tax=uncultured Tateyamaria sp. TaxID=455651 RepID=UPI0026282F98|nr:BrnA antitoxin family protein [uncultured Tateyamaria sp.]
MTHSTRTGHKADMTTELERLQDDLFVNWIDRSLPDDWDGLDYREPVARHRTRITMRVDSDMLRWFRKLGPGYQARMNRVLRIYWTSLLAGHIKGYPDDNVFPRVHAEAMRVLEGMKADRGGRDLTE